MESTNPAPRPGADLWVRTEPNPDPTADAYLIAVSFGDVAFELTPAEAVAYATHIFGVVARADYDAAVADQQAAMGLDPAIVGRCTYELRCARPPLEPAAWPWPLEFRGIVSGRTGGPLINLVVKERPVSQVEPHVALGHAMGALDLAHVATLDQVYYRWLTGTIGTDDAKARHAVMTLSDHYRRRPQ